MQETEAERQARFSNYLAATGKVTRGMLGKIRRAVRKMEKRYENRFLGCYDESDMCGRFLAAGVPIMQYTSAQLARLLNEFFRIEAEVEARYADRSDEEGEKMLSELELAQDAYLRRAAGLKNLGNG